jgi:hypothetical protein
MAENTEKIRDEGVREIDLIDLLLVLLKHKWLILSSVAVAAVFGFIYPILQSESLENKKLPLSEEPAIYYSECLIEANQVPLDRITRLILRRNFVFQMIEENHLRNDFQKVFKAEKKGNNAGHEWVSLREIYRSLNDNLFLSPSGNLLTIGFASRQKDFPPKVVNAFIFSLSENFRKRELESNTKQLDSLSRRLVDARDPFLKARIAERVTMQMDKLAQIRSVKYYGFDLLDPPSLIDRVRIVWKGSEKRIESQESRGVPPPPIRPKRPKYGMIFLLLILASLVVSVTLAFFLEYLGNMKTREPGKVAALKRYFSIRQK